MNAPPALVEAFLGRLGRLIDGARELPRDRVLVRAAPVALPDPHAAEDMRAGGIAWAFPGGPLPLPFTAGMALDILTPEAPTVAAELAAELYRLAVALVDPAVLDRVLEVHLAEIVTGWPLPYREDGRIVYDVLDVLVTVLWKPVTAHDALYFGPPGSVRSRWPDVNPVAVAEWARPGVDRVTGNDYGSRMARDMKHAETEFGAAELAYIGLPGFTLPPDRAGPRRTPGLGLALLYLAERAELPRVRAAAAARLAFASARALAAARDPGPLHFAALEAVLGEDGADDLAGRVLADGATRARFAAELVTMARTVAERALTGDAPEGEPEARALAREVAEHFAAVLDGFDPRAGANVRTAAVERAEAVLDGRKPPGALWILWTDPDAPEAPPRWLQMLARALWLGPDGWRAKLAAPPKFLPGLTVRTGRALVDMLSPAAVVHRGPVVTEIVSLAGRLAGQIESDDVRRMMPPAVNAEAVRRMTSEIVKARAAVAAVYALVQAVYTVTDLENRGDKSLRASWESWPGWVAEVSSTFGVDPTDELAGALKRAAWFGNAVQVPLFDGRIQRGLWTLTAPDPFKRGAPRAGDSRVVTFGYAPIFSPGWASQENPDNRNRGVRMVVIPRTFPIGVADRAVRAPVLLFTLDVLAEVAMCLNPRRGLDLAEQRRAEIARRVGLPEAYALRQLSAMVEAGILEVVGPNRYRLGSEEARLKASPKRQRKADKPGSA